MTILTADSGLQSALGPLNDITKIRLPDGKLLGTFAPATAEAVEALRSAALESYLEELRRRATSKDVLSFDQVMDRLRALENVQ